ncbi:MAG TPA: ABC transporter permease [Methylomirabilota bacterium]|nr:ABC transporter permease [Methylomirabilota bacterium]
MIGFLVGEAFRDLRRAGRVAASAIVLTTLSLGAVGVFLILSENLGHAVASWRDRLRVTVYLKQEPSTTAASALVRRVEGLPGVASVRYVNRSDALDTLKKVLGKDAVAADQLSSNPLPASLEVTPSAEGATPDGARRLVEQLAALPEADDVAGGVEWVDRFARLQRLVTVVGLGFGGVLAVAAILTVTTATTLVLHARRHETEIMRLVGAPEFAIRMPLLLQGMVQGMLGAALALAALAVAHHFLAPKLRPLMTVALGVDAVMFLGIPQIAAIALAGTALGAFGGFLARGR